MRNYQCSKCRTLLKRDSMPSALHCPEGGQHLWNNLGDVGNKDYQCSNCSTLVQTNQTPSALHCPNGGQHSWHKL